MLLFLAYYAYWLRPIAMLLFWPPLQPRTQTLLGRATRHAAHTPGGLKSMDFQPPQWGSARTAPHRAPRTAHRRRAAKSFKIYNLLPHCTFRTKSRTGRPDGSSRSRCLSRKLIPSPMFIRSGPLVAAAAGLHSGSGGVDRARGASSA